VTAGCTLCVFAPSMVYRGPQSSTDGSGSVCLYTCFKVVECLSYHLFLLQRLAYGTIGTDGRASSCSLLRPEAEGTTGLRWS
jgi:hypothetical protein